MIRFEPKFPHWIAYLLALGLVVVCGCQPSPANRPPAPPASVSVATPLVRPIVEWSEFTGRVEATRFVEIRSRVGGYLESVHFTEGQDVEKDALLFVIDPRPFKAEWSKALAALDEAKAQLIRAQAQAEQATASASTSEAQIELAKAEYNRAQGLGNALSQSERDVIRSEFQKATAALESTRAGIASANAEVARATAAIAMAEAAVQSAELNLEYTNIRAPIAGRISRRYTTEGNLISGGSEQATLLTTIVSLDPIYFTFNASEQQVLRFQRMVQAGTRRSALDVKYPVALQLADEVGFPRQGYLDFVDNRFDPGTATKLVRAVFENTDGLLTPGMFGKLQFALTDEYPALLLPDEAIGTDQTEKFVYVVMPDNSVRRQTVAIGPMALGLRVIRNGITDQDRVVIRGLQRIRPGATVDPKPATIATAQSESPVSPVSPVSPESPVSPVAPLEKP